MRSTRLRYLILLLLGLVPIMLNACASGSGSSDPPVTASIVEDQDASDGTHGMSVITLGFSTRETKPPSQVIFTNGESVNCNNNNNSITLGNFTSYWFRVTIPYNSSYICYYHYFLNGLKKSATIFTVHAAQHPLSPVLKRPTNGNIQVHYIPGPTITNASNCTVQVTANAPNQSASGDTVPQKGDIYTGPDAGGLNGSGDIVMTRNCVPINFNHDNDADDHGSTFAAVNVTYTSTASYEVSWFSSGSPTQGTIS
jgi:hypothetical protein